MSNLWRYETKLVVRDLPISEVLNDIYLNPLGFRTSFESRTVNNLYFDTQLLDCFHDHINGYTQRSKVRLRWYGDFSSFKNVTLEIKRKDGNVGTKDSYPCAVPLTMKSIMSFREIVKYLEMPLQKKELLSNLQPALFNRYNRSYFVSANSKVRLTLDSDIAHKSIHSNTWVPELDGLKIVEFKYNNVNFAEGKRALKNFHHVQEKSSKYIRGLLRIT